MSSEQQPMDIYRPPSHSRTLEYDTCPKLRFDTSHLEAGNPVHMRTRLNPYLYNPYLKMLCNDVDFLTKKAETGDKAIYIGGSIGAYVLLLAKMFPTVQFDMYDHNLSNSVKKAKEESFMPPNLEHKPENFSEKVAAQLLLKDGIKGNKLLLMSDLRNITRNAWGNKGHVAVTDDNVVNDLHLQENWVQLLRPRSSQIKFKLPYHGSVQYSYLKGEANTQLFGKHSTSEIRLTVDAPLEESREFPRYMYDKQKHEDSMYYHNFVTRFQHTEATNRIKLSFDQHAAHNIFAQWKDRVMTDASMSGIRDEDDRRTWVQARICELDQSFDRSLGLRMSEQLRDDVIAGHQHNALNPGADAASGTVIDNAMEKKVRNRMWRKNVNGAKKRGRASSGGGGGCTVFTGGNSSLENQPDQCTSNSFSRGQSAAGPDELEEGEI